MGAKTLEWSDGSGAPEAIFAGSDRAEPEQNCGDLVIFKAEPSEILGDHYGIEIDDVVCTQRGNERSPYLPGKVGVVVGNGRQMRLDHVDIGLRSAGTPATRAIPSAVR